MIKKFIDKLLGKSAGGAQGKSRFGKRQEVPAEVHKIDPALVDERARNVVTTLQQAGYEAYVVGGAVRVLLLGLRQEGRHGQRPQPPFPALQDAIDDVFNSRIGDVSGRGKLAADMREIWMMQPRFDKRTGSTP